MAANTTEYLTKPGDRWDLIAYKAYGTFTRIDESGNTVSTIADVIQANPDIDIADELPEGILLQIPIIPFAVTKTDQSLLPPWKRTN